MAVRRKTTFFDDGTERVVRKKKEEKKHDKQRAQTAAVEIRQVVVSSENYARILRLRTCRAAVVYNSLKAFANAQARFDHIVPSPR